MILDYIIVLPLVAGLMLFIFPERLMGLKAAIALFISVVVMYQVAVIYFDKMITSAAHQLSLAPGEWSEQIFRFDALSELILLLISFFSVLIMIYSLTFFKKDEQPRHYHTYILFTLAGANGAAIADNLFLFLLLWSFLALTLYKLIPGRNEKSAAAAMKSLIIIGGSDVLMLFGIAIIWSATQTMTMSGLHVMTDSFLTNIAFITLLIGAFAKAGAFPFHSWIPDFAQEAPATSSAYLPASLDKLLGIYFMARLCHEIFILNQWLTLAILSIGVFTIIIAVMMALIQHNYKKLLGYHAVSQVGYMVTGLGLGTALGIIGGLFHMVNHALYKSGLFLVAGSIKKQTGEDRIEKLGGLSGNMPVTFITALIFALAISGIPPLNGFASKWIIYQAIIDFGKTPGLANSLWIVWLALAVIGSALTLASFIKFISGIFLGRKKPELTQVKESFWLMQLPMMIIALFCLGFGVFATGHVVPFLFYDIAGATAYVGSWDSVMVTLLILASIAIGIIIYLIGNVKKFRKEDSFIGGERLQGSTGFAVTDFYRTISDFKPFSSIYDKAEHKWFDIYELSKGGILRLAHLLKSVHTGLLQTYAFWLIMGLILMMILLLLF